MTDSVCLIEAAELTVLRVTCSACGLTTEVKVDSAKKALSDSGECKHCHAALMDTSDRNPLHTLTLALRALSASDKCRVQFLLRNAPAK